MLSGKKTRLKNKLIQLGNCDYNNSFKGVGFLQIMVAIDELKGLIEQSNYVGRAANGLAEILINSIKAGETKFDEKSGFYFIYGPVPSIGTFVYFGLLIRLRLIEPHGLGDEVVGYPLTRKGVDLGKKLLEESRQIASTR